MKPNPTFLLGAVSTSTLWELKGHSHQIADTGDYDGYYEITNGKISLLTKDDDDESLQPIVDALNDSGCKFYQDDWFEFENNMLKEEISRLKFMIDKLDRLMNMQKMHLKTKKMSKCGICSITPHPPQTPNP